MSSFDASRMSSSFSSLPTHAPYTNPSPHNPVSRSFGPINGQRSQSSLSAAQAGPQIYTAVYSGVAVYEMEVQGVAVMRRRSDSWLNATQILKVAGIDKGKRTKILEKEILTGEHEKVQGGYGRYQGTWISYTRGRQFCRQYDVEDSLRPLLDYDIKSDGTGNASKADTPTKEQAMAANRKRLFNPNVGDRLNGSLSNGTFFQNISPTASNALAAMNKAARFESPVVRPNSAHRRPGSITRNPSQQQGDGQGSEMHSFIDGVGDMDSQTEPTYGPVDSQRTVDYRSSDIQEPPRKRMRPSSSQDTHPLDPALREDTATEPNESFFQSHNAMDLDGAPRSLPPLHPLTDKVTEQKRLTLLALFEESTRSDTDSQRALRQLSGQDLDIPLDTSANTALHWAATLARVPLMKMLIARGANIMIGNAASQTPLMAAVQVNNSLDHSCFPEMLDILGPLIDVRDSAGRTVLHHIAVSSGIKGRGQSSRYYLESLLAFTVRQGSSNPNSQQSSFTANPTQKKTINLGRFMSEVVNVQDKSGNTALNLVSRIGNRPIINQLEEVGADFDIPNNTGFKPADFGVFPRSQASTQHSSNEVATMTASQEPSPSQVDQIKEEIFATTTSILAQTQLQYQSELAKNQEQLDHQNAKLRDISTAHRDEQARFEGLQQRARARLARQQKAVNLKRAMKEQMKRAQEKGWLAADGATRNVSPASAFEIDLSALPPPLEQDMVDGDTDMHDPPISLQFTHPLPRPSALRAHLSAHKASNQELSAQVTVLKGRSSEIESQYRKVVSMCTGVEEGNVDAVLEGLVAAVESERMRGVEEVGRVREFLRKVGDVGC